MRFSTRNFPMQFVEFFNSIGRLLPIWHPFFNDGY